MYTNLEKCLLEYNAFDKKNRILFIQDTVLQGYILKQRRKAREKWAPEFHQKGVLDNNHSQYFFCRNGIRELFCLGYQKCKSLTEQVKLPKLRKYAHVSNKNVWSVEVSNGSCSWRWPVSGNKFRSWNDRNRYTQMMTRWVHLHSGQVVTCATLFVHSLPLEDFGKIIFHSWRLEHLQKISAYNVVYFKTNSNTPSKKDMIPTVLMMVSQLIMISVPKIIVVFAMILKKILLFKQQSMWSTHAPSEHFQTKKLRMRHSQTTIPTKFLTKIRFRQ